MPFPISLGVPESVSQASLRILRASIIACVSQEMGVPAKTVRPFFPVDRAGDPDPGQDDTIYCKIDTGMFGRSIFKEIPAMLARAVGWKDPVHEKRKRVTSEVAKIIWLFFDGKYEVEVFIGDLIPLGKTLLKPR